MSMVDSFEKIPVKIFGSLEEGSRFIGKEIATLIRAKEKKGEKTVLGLATGSSPQIPVCRVGPSSPGRKAEF
jgi:glucosamine-6-phosphate deaminase